jgi:hypothetical protein
MDADVKTAAAEPSPAAPAAPQEVSSLSGDAYQQWRMTGKLPENKPTTEEPATSDEQDQQDPSDPAAEEAAGESAPASEAGKQGQAAAKPRSNAQTRIQELLAENKRLKAEADARKAPETAKAAPSPAAQAPAKLEAPKKPVQAEFEKQGKSWEDFEAAQEKYLEDLASYRAELAVENYKAQQREEEGRKHWQGEMAKAKERYADVEQVIQPAGMQLMNDQQVPVELKAMLGNSPLLIDVLYTLGTDQKALDDFISTAKSDVYAAMRKLAALEFAIGEELKTPAQGKDKQAAPERDASGKFITAPATEKKVTGAPRVPPDIGGHGTAPADEVAAAAEKGFSEYQRTANARDLARAKG